MIEIPRNFPFTKLKISRSETLIWTGYNPTFHRFLVYGLAISDMALYVCSRAWIFANWKRYPISEISDISVDPENLRPALRFRAGGNRIVFRTPSDVHEREAEFDRSVLRKAAEVLKTIREGIS